MHLLVTNIFFAPFSHGGATVVAEEVVREIIRQTGWRVTVISANASVGIRPYSHIRSDGGGGVTNIIIGLPPILGGEDAYLNPQVEAVFGDLLDSLAPDLVHAHCLQNIGAGGLRQVAHRGIPLILSIHDFWWLCERQFMIDGKGCYCGRDQINPDLCRACVDDIDATRLRDRALRDILARADVITYPSQFTRDLHERSGVQAEKGVVWPNGVTLPGPGFFDRQAARRAADGRIAFGFVGKPSQIKGWPVIRQAFAQLKRQDFIVNVVDASPDQSWWRPGQFAGLPGEWRILPRYSQANIDDFYAGIDVLLFLSQWKETFGLTLREAAARGLDILQTAGGGTTEYSGVENAHIVQIGDGPQIVAARLEQILDGPLRGQPAKTRGYDQQAAQMIQIMRDLLAQTTRA